MMTMTMMTSTMKRKMEDGSATAQRTSKTAARVAKSNSTSILELRGGPVKILNATLTFAICAFDGCSTARKIEWTQAG